MTTDTSNEAYEGLAAALNAADDRRFFDSSTWESQAFQAYQGGTSVKMERRGTFDPSGGALYSGGSSWVPGMPLLSSEAGLAGSFGAYSEDPLFALCNFPAGFGGIDAVERKAFVDPHRTSDYQLVLSAATQPGTPFAASIANKLIDKSLKLAELADNRAAVTQSARQNFTKLEKEVSDLEVEEKRLLTKLDFLGANRARAKATEKAQLAVRFQKVNALASGLTENALAQAALAQNLVHAVLGGRPDVAAVYGVAYDKLSGHSEKIRAIRELQLKKAQSGLSDFEPPDMFERFLYNEYRPDPSNFSGLGDLEGKIWRKFSKKVARFERKIGIRGALTSIRDGLKSAAREIGRVAAIITVGVACKIAKSKFMGQVESVAGMAIGEVYGGPAGAAAGQIAAERSHAANATFCHGLDRIGITSGHFRKGQVKAAFEGVARELKRQTLDPKAALNNLTTIGVSYASAGVGSYAKYLGVDASKLLTGKLVAKFVSGKGLTAAEAALKKKLGPQLQNLLKNKAVKISSQEALKLLKSGKIPGADSFGQKAFSLFNLDVNSYGKRMEQVAIDHAQALANQVLDIKIAKQASSLYAGALKTPNLLAMVESK